MRLIEGENGFNVNLSPVRQEQQLVDGFAGREKKCPVVEVDLDLEFRLEVRDQPRGGSDRHDLDGRACGFDWIKSVGISHARRKLRTSALVVPYRVWLKRKPDNSDSYRQRQMMLAERLAEIFAGVKVGIPWSEGAGLAQARIVLNLVS